MKRTRWAGRTLGGLALAALAGCQTQIPATGQTLPSGRYLQHPPQYFAPSPPYPLPRELAAQERAAAAAAAAAAAGGLPPEALPPRVPAAGAGPAPLPPPGPAPLPAPPP
jgi:hypothetical protein